MATPFDPSDVAYNPYDRPIPGASLTVEPGSRPWEQPPQYVDPDEFIEYLLDKFSEEQNAHRAFALMEAGMSIETIVKTVMTAAFAEGKITPDVALLSAGPFAGFLKLIADDAGIKATLRDDEPPSTDLAELMEAVQEGGEIDPMEEAAEEAEAPAPEEEKIAAPPSGGLLSPLE